MITFSECSSVWSESSVWGGVVGGSNPLIPTMPKLVSKPEKVWFVRVKCRGGCRYVYDYFEHDLWKDSFKISGNHFDGTAVCKEKIYVKCANCEKVHFVDVPKYVAKKATQED